MENSEAISPGKKIAFASADIFGGGSFNIINFLFVPFLTLVVGIPMIWATPILLFSKVWDGIIDPFIGKITDGKKPGKYGKRRYFMLIAAPLVLVTLVLLFFPWNLVSSSVPLKIVFVVLSYMLYATAQSFVLIPYYSHASELTEDYTQRNKANAVRIAFSVASSLICVVVPGLIAGPQKATEDGGVCYIIMASLFGVIFAISIIVTAIFSKEQVVTPATQTKLSLKGFFRPLKMKTYRQYLGMQMCTSMGMAIMSSFFYTFCDFYLRRMSYAAVTLSGSAISRFPVATVAAAMMFVAQIFALPFYLWLIKKTSKKVAYSIGAGIWILCVVVMFFLPAETAVKIGDAVINYDADGLWLMQLQTVAALSGEASVIVTAGVPDWLVMVLGLLTGFGIGGAMFIPHSSFGDVCDAGQLFFGERTEGEFSGLTNFLNTTAQAIGLAIPPVFIGLAGYVETQYVDAGSLSGFDLTRYTVQKFGDNYQLMPLSQTADAQLAIRLTFIVLPIVICAIGIFIASRYKLTGEKQKQIVETLALDKDSAEYAEKRKEIIDSL